MTIQIARARAQEFPAKLPLNIPLEGFPNYD